MTLADNPVERLERIVLSVHGFDPKTKLGAVYRQVFGSTSDADLHRQIGFMLELPDQAHGAVRLAAGDDGEKAEHYSAWYGPTHYAIHLVNNLQTQVAEFLSQTSETVLYSLKGAAMLVGGYSGREVPAGTEDLTAQLETIHETIVADKTLSPDLKRFLLVQIDRVRVALREFVIRGAASADDAQDAIAGAILRANMTHPIEEWSEGGKSHLKSILKAADALGTLLTTSTAVLLLPEAIANAIGYIP